MHESLAVVETGQRNELGPGMLGAVPQRFEPRIFLADVEKRRHGDMVEHRRKIRHWRLHDGCQRPRVVLQHDGPHLGRQFLFDHRFEGGDESLAVAAVDAMEGAEPGISGVAAPMTRELRRSGAKWASAKPTRPPME